MRTINDILDRLKATIQEIGVSSATGVLHKGTEGLQQQLKDTRVLIDLYASQHFYNADSSLFRQLCNPLQIVQGKQTLEKYIINARDPKKKYIKKAGELFPVVCVVFLDETLLSDIPFVEKIKNRAKNYAVTIIFHSANVQASLRGFNRPFAGKLYTYPIEEVTSTLETTCNSLIKDETRDQLYVHSFVQSVEPLVHILDEAIQNENHLINVRKNINSQLTTVLKKEEGRINFNEFSSTLKTMVQQRYTEAEKELRSKYDDLNKPNIGFFSNDTQGLISEITDFERKELAEKSERVGIALKDSFLDMTSHLVNKNLTENFLEDKMNLKKLTNTLDRDISGLFEARSIVYQKTDMELPDDKTYQKVINTYGRFSKPYTGELIKKGPMEYFVALRDYTGLIMVVAGLLAPLNMISSISDNPTLKKMSVGIRMCTGVITLLMIIYGFYDLRKRIPRRRKEEFEREIYRAKDFVSNECRKIYLDSTREWSSLLVTWLKDHYANTLMAIERSIKSHISNAQENLNSEKLKVQKVIQGLDVNQKKLSYADKSKDQLVSRFRDLDSDNRKQLKTLLN